MICRIEDDPEKSIHHWKILPYLANYQDPGTPKPGAVVLASVDAGGKHLPLLITENYGRGRTAVFATGGSWRWRMQQPVGTPARKLSGGNCCVDGRRYPFARGGVHTKCRVSKTTAKSNFAPKSAIKSIYPRATPTCKPT